LAQQAGRETSGRILSSKPNQPPIFLNSAFSIFKHDSFHNLNQYRTGIQLKFVA
jgi:hypothetical protein